MPWWGTILFFLLMFSASPVSALTFDFTDLPSEIDEDREFEVSLNFSCPGCGDSYFRGVMYKPDTIKYFGYTLNNDNNWVNDISDKSLYFHIFHDELIDGSWSGKLKFKPDRANSYYSGPGNYLFKIGRYTSAGDSSADWTEFDPLTINGPTPTPVPTPTIKPTSIPDATHTPSPKPTSKLVSVPSLTPVPKVTAKFMPVPANFPFPSLLVLAAEITASPTAETAMVFPTPETLVLASDSSPSLWPPIMLIIAGITFITTSVVVHLRSRLPKNQGL